MKKFFYCVILVIAGVSGSILAQNRSIKAYLSYAVFSAPEKGPYIETYITIPGNSVFFKKQKNTFRATISISLLFNQDGKAVQGGTYNLNSSEIVDTTKKPVLIDVQRYALKPGKYEMSLTIKDANLPTSEGLKASQMIEITEPAADSMALSDIELLESFAKAEAPSVLSKSGYDLVPYVLRYIPESVNKISFYTEAYHSDKKIGNDARFMFSYFIEDASNQERISGMSEYSKQKTANVNPLLGQFDISPLPTGEYNLVVEARNTKNELVCEKKVRFTRVANVKIRLDDIKSIDTAGTFVSHVYNPDTLRDYIECLWPISSTTERDWQYSQMKNNDVKLMQQYLYAFWVNRESRNPELAWKTYRAQAVMVKKMYACGKTPGYRTDRGRVYLQYGAPSAAQQVPAEPDSYPYEIWQYYRIKDPATGTFQTNKKFVFYNRELDGKCYQLIHSDARGEMRDDRWQIKLKQRNNQIMNLDQNTPNTNSYGSGADDLFQNPR